MLLRWLVFAALSATGLGLLLLLASVLMSPRHQGWHDRVAHAVVIVERPLAPRPANPATARASAPAAPAPTSASTPTAAVPTPPAQPPTPVSAPAVAGDPAIGPDLAPLAADPAPSSVSPEGSGSDTDATRRTILDGWVAELDDGREIVVRAWCCSAATRSRAARARRTRSWSSCPTSRAPSPRPPRARRRRRGPLRRRRGSTNGSTITAPGQPTVPVGAFHAVSVSEGSVVSIGDHWVRIRRTAR